MGSAKKKQTKTKATKKTKATNKTIARTAVKAKTAPQNDLLRTKVLSDREDEATLRVWADALLERSDPRGELIQLQLSPPSEACNKLIASHIRKHARALLGDLASVCMLNDHLVFDRGLISECAIATDSRPKIASVVGHADWTTVRSIYFRNYSGGSITPFEERHAHPAIALLLDLSQQSPQLSSPTLEVALGIGLGDVFAALCASTKPLSLKRVYLMDYDYEDETPAEIRRQIQKSTALPHLRWIGMEATPKDWFFESAWIKQLDTLEMGIDATLVADALASVEEKAPHIKTVIVRPDGVFENGHDRPEWIYTFAKEQKRFTTVTITARDVPGDPKRKKSFLAKLPKSLKVIRSESGVV